MFTFLTKEVYLYKGGVNIETEILNFFISQGVFAVLFGYLLLYVLKENSNREAKYQKLLYHLTELLPEIKQDISSIKESLHNK